MIVWKNVVKLGNASVAKLPSRLKLAADRSWSRTECIFRLHVHHWSTCRSTLHCYLNWRVKRNCTQRVGSAPSYDEIHERASEYCFDRSGMRRRNWKNRHWRYGARWNSCFSVRCAIWRGAHAVWHATTTTTTTTTAVAATDRWE